jgi:hypothetical protein
LKSIENILKAEQKRRVDSNAIMQDYLVNYLDQLQQALGDRVSTQYNSLKHSIDHIDQVITKMENEILIQEANIKAVIADRKRQADREV